MEKIQKEKRKTRTKKYGPSLHVQNVARGLYI